MKLSLLKSEKLEMKQGIKYRVLYKLTLERKLG